jgi:hypothetical protein
MKASRSLQQPPHGNGSGPLRPLKTPDPYASAKPRRDFSMISMEWLAAAMLAAFVIYAAVRAWAG